MQKFQFLAAIGLASMIASGALASPPPSVDDIIGSLTPSSVKQPCPPGTPCRGIRASAPAAGTVQLNHGGSSTATASTSSGKGSGTLDLTVEFPTASATLTPAVKASLTHLGQALASPQLASYRFRIEGHTDTVGDASKNQTLSERRANSVVSFLTSSFHINPARLEAVGMGEQDLAVQTPAQTPEARNRRVHIVNLGS